MGAVQPRLAMRSSQSLASGFLKVAFRPPQTVSSSGMGVRMLSGQFASSQARTSARNAPAGSKESGSPMGARYPAALRYGDAP